MKKEWLTKVSWRNNKAVSYSYYQLSIKEVIIYLFQGSFLIVIITYLFYQNIFWTIGALPLSIGYLFYQKQQLIQKRRELLRQEFKEGMLCIMASLSAGYSIENAWRESERELILLLGEGSLVVVEFHQMVKQIEGGKAVEQVMRAFALKTGIEEIVSFSESLTLAKERGGNLIEIMNQTVIKLTDKMNIMEEAAVLVAARKFEQKMMNLIPLGLILFLNVSAPEFLQVLYTTSLGRIVMTACLAIYLGAFLWSEKILRIEF